VGNWQGDVAKSWWQDSGFHTSVDFFSFGQCLVSPLFSGFHGFADGVYSTLWGDGLISGKPELVFRPPWNYDLMNAGYWLAGAISVLGIAGFILVLFNFIRRPTATWFVTFGMVALFGLGMIFMALQVPSYGQIKAFYGFPALVPFSALIAAGWDWMAQKNRAVRAALWSIVLFWVLTVYATFWIGNHNAETWRPRGISELQQQDPADAVESVSRALQLKPDDAVSHC